MKQGVEFFHNLNFCFQKWFRSGFQGGGDSMHLHEVQFKGSTEIKNRALNSYVIQNNVRALIIVLKMGDIFINRISTNENAEV